MPPDTFRNSEERYLLPTEPGEEPEKHSRERVFIPGRPGEKFRETIREVQKEGNRIGLMVLRVRHE